MRLQRTRCSSEAGFTLVTVMGAMLVLTLMTTATLAAVMGDLPQSHKDVARKQAYAAAEAGVADYLFHLQQDPNYWANCTGVPSPSAVNNVWNGSGTDTRLNWRNVPGTTSQYAIELIPRSPYTQCTTGTNVAASMIDPSTRTMQIRVTGRYQNAKRSIVASLGIGGFLDFLYFTDLETSDPVWYDLSTGGRPTSGTDSKSLIDWAAQDGTQSSGDGCAQWWRAGRSSSGNTWSGIYTDNYRSAGTVSCTKIQFASGDILAGPVHTNDDLYTCNATFGSEDTDAIESGESWRSACFGANPTFKGNWKPNSPTLTLPTTDATLSSVVDSAYSFTGKTTIVLGASTLQITNNGTTTTKAYPPGGVIYVANGTCGQSYKVLDPYGDTNAIPSGCADVYVSGTYNSQELTIASQKDIIVNGDIKRAAGGDGLLGLIADNFVRVYHKVNRSDYDPTDCTNASYTVIHQIDAAILALAHSFTVDNYYCGSSLGTLTVNGAIAQKFRGPVGTSGYSGSGYLKDYIYDKRFQYRVPPHFLSPLETSWRVKRYTEQTKAR